MEKVVPWCTVFLVVATLLCHTMVLIGNLETASAMNSIGASTAGWSKVGLGISRSFKIELDEHLHTISLELTDAINQTLVVQKYLDVIVSAVGNATEQSQQNATAGNVTSLLQTRKAKGPANSTSGAIAAESQELSDFMMAGVKDVMEKTMEELNEVIDMFLEKIKPALIKVGDLILKFGDKLTQALEGFSNGLDKVQKIFDQIMSQVAGKAPNATVDLMIHDTFTLFDVSHTGYIAVDDLLEVGEIYGVAALQGSKPSELLKKYDEDGDNQLSKSEFMLFVEDPSIPNSMAVVLRAYAKRLTVVAGNVASAKMRDEVAMAVTKYFQLVCAKNRTKLDWVADALTNGSLPLAFTADIFKNLAEEVDDPDVLTTADVGQVVTSAMMELNPSYTLQAVDLMSNASFWTSEGFKPSDQPLAIQRVSTWVAGAKKEMVSLLEEGHQDYMRAELLDAMPAMARMVAEEGMARHLSEKHAAAASRRKMLFATDSSKYLLHHLFGGAAPSESAGSAMAEQSVNSGVPARPETLQFAQWLSNNASSTSERFQKQCMDYSGKSSSTLDSFATQIQGMVKKISSFIKMMEKYSTPAGIDQLETQLKGCVMNASSDMEKVVSQKIQKFVDETCPKIVVAADNAIETVGQQLGSMLSNLTMSPLLGAMQGPLESAIGTALNNPDAGSILGDLLGNVTSDKLTNFTGQVLGKEIADYLNQSMYKAIDQGTQAVESLENKMSLLAVGSEVSSEQEALELELGGSFDKIASLFQELMNFLPQATDNLKFARQEVGEVAKVLESVFSNFEVKGPAIFGQASEAYALIWTLYFVFLLPMTLGMLVYGFWASGYLGGPSLSTDEYQVKEPHTFSEHCQNCCSACGYCLRGFHDTTMCFWSCVILLEIVCLLLFVISVVFCVLAGLQEFMVAGCAQVYMLADEKICYETIKVLRDFQQTFYVTSPTRPLDDVCGYNNLLTCQMISEKMKTSGIFTCVFSFLAVVFSFQLIVNSAMMHTRARWIRIIEEKKLELLETREA